MLRFLKFSFLTTVIAAFLSIPMSVIWEVNFPGKIYHCTDDVGFGYFLPGDWIHGDAESLAEVRSATSRPMSEPDVIREGWSIGKLWLFWSLMFGSSVGLGALGAVCLISRSSGNRRRLAENLTQ